MKIGIVGAGNIGNALARRFHEVGHEISVANSRGLETLIDFARETGSQAVSVEQAARENDVVVLAITPKGIPKLPIGLFDGTAASLPIIDTTNYYPRERDGKIDGIEDGLTESAWVENQIGRPVVKAFNMILAADILGGGMPAGSPGRIAVAVADDDPVSKHIVMRLIEEIGFDPIDAGSVSESWRQQPGSPVYCKGLDANGARSALSNANPIRPVEFQATSKSPGSYEFPA